MIRKSRSFRDKNSGGEKILPNNSDKEHDEEIDAVVLPKGLRENPKPMDMVRVKCDCGSIGQWDFFILSIDLSTSRGRKKVRRINLKCSNCKEIISFSPSNVFRDIDKIFEKRK